MNQQLTNLEKELKKLQPQPISNITKQVIMEEIAELEHQKQNKKPITIQKILLQIAAIIIVILSLVIVQQKQDYNKIKNALASQKQPTLTTTKPNKQTINGIPIGTLTPNGTIPRIDDQYQKVSTQTYLVSKQDEGIVRVSNQTAPLRKVRYKLVDQVKWQNKNGKKEYMTTEPREQIMYISTDSL